MPRSTQTIVFAHAERCHGSGWTNDVVWVLLRDEASGKLSLDSIQVEEASKDIRLLFSAVEPGGKALTAAVSRHLKLKLE